MLFIALVLSGLIFFGFYKWTGGNDLYTWVSAVASLLYLTTMLALQSDEAYQRGTAMLKVFSSVIFVIALAANILFARYNASSTTFIITNGALFCIWAGICYGLRSAKQ